MPPLVHLVLAEAEQIGPRISTDLCRLELVHALAPRSYYVGNRPTAVKPEVEDSLTYVTCALVHVPEQDYKALNVHPFQYPLPVAFSRRRATIWLRLRALQHRVDRQHRFFTFLRLQSKAEATAVSWRASLLQPLERPTL